MSSKFHTICKYNYAAYYLVYLLGAYDSVIKKSSIKAELINYTDYNTTHLPLDTWKISKIYIDSLLLCVYNLVYTKGGPIMPKLKNENKTVILKACGALHPHPEAVKDDVFHTHEFFDPRDRVQVKYEMLRSHRVDGKPVIKTAATFGVSRQAYYGAQRAFKICGISGLLEKQRGPKGAHKCTNEILDFAENWNASEHDAKETLPQAVLRIFGRKLHQRSIERALIRRKKKRKSNPHKKS